ncbi:diguanylate cyclase domain-containing protein [Halomonas sp. 328]|uniref:diguanylate cyclase domain-containing protein n=1 Tax=Halomonas sp. 328 TaxID=2776704 RepID=UPI001E4E6648|nr:diguanylate cyclase [Halomonas sp. 328]
MKGLLCRWLLSCVVLLCGMPQGLADQEGGAYSAADETLTLGVFAYRPPEVMEARYRPLADYLSEQLGDARVALEVLGLDEIESAIAQRRLDLLMTNPSHYLQVRSRSSLTGALATMINAEQGEAVTHLGGVMIRAAHANEIQALSDLRGRRIAIPGERFLGGFQAHVFELHQAGIELGRDTQLMELGSHDAVVQAVLSGRAEVGLIRTGILERLIASGELEAGRLAVINPQRLVDFPYQVSTRLYPEWPFIALPQVAPERVRQVAVALFSLSPEHPAARAAHIAGFAPPQDYLPVEQLARTLRLAPFDAAPQFTWGDIWARYWMGLLGAGVGLVLVAGLLLLLWHRNRLMRHQQDRLRLLASVFSHSHEGIMITSPAGEILEVNEAFTRITGYSRDEAVGHNARLLSAGRHEPEFYASLWRQLLERGNWEGEVWNRRKGGQAYPQRLTISAVNDEAGQLQRYVGLMSDITEFKAHQQALEHAAQHDVLTDLPNRLLLADRLRQGIHQASRDGRHLAVIFIDLDGFKAVNDRHGHAAGDQLLVTLARRMGQELRDSDTLARLGGDEFVAVVTHLASPAAGQAIIDRLLAAASAPVPLAAGLEVRVSGSLGVAYYAPGQEIDADTLLRQADQAMYRAKSEGKNRVRLSSE